MIEASSPTQFTDGDFAQEAEAWADLDRRLEECGLFTVYREVTGCLLQPRPESERKQMRIDRLLVPVASKFRSFRQNWTCGVIGVEAKRSGHPLGRTICQAMDYTRTQWHLPLGIDVNAKWVMLWPCTPTTGDIGSVMTQHRIGCAHAPDNGLLAFNVGGTNMLYVMKNGVPICKPIAAGGKAGSR